MGVKTLEDVSMATVRYQPWAVVSQLQDEINRVFGNLNDADSSSATAEWVPAVDVSEYPEHFELLIDLPGVDPQAVEITLDNGVLPYPESVGTRNRRLPEMATMGFGRSEESGVKVVFTGDLSCRIRPMRKASMRRGATACSRSPSRNMRRHSRDAFP